MKIIKLFLFIASVIFQLVVFSDIIKRKVDNLTLILWLFSLLSFFFSFPFQKIKRNLAKNLSFESKDIFLVVLIILVGIGIRIFLMKNDYSFHNDEYLTAYFSYSVGNLIKGVDWFGIYPLPRDWIWQFPGLYFFLQKIFLDFLGISTFTIRLSTLPYLISIFIFLFLIAKNLYGKITGFLTILILAFFSPDLYLSRWNLHFISSTAFFLITFHFFLLSIKTNQKKYFGLLGFFMGLCYMTYYSSWITAPLIFFYTLILLIKKQVSFKTIRNLFFSLIIFIYTISPLIVYATKVENFITTRINQVKLINGSWSPYKNLNNPKEIFKILEKQTLLSVNSFYIDGIGGQQGFLFGRLALLDKITFIFLIIGILNFFYKILFRNNIDSLFILTIVFITFLTGMVLTAPSPAFHRIFLIFPIICLILGTTVGDIYMFIKTRHKTIGFIVLLLCISLISISNIFHFKKVLLNDGPDDPDYPQIQQYLTTEGKNFFYVAAFESYGMGKILFIRSGEKSTQ